jgi:hypothetical protein
MECCGDPFEIDEHVRWRLLFVETDRSDLEPVERRVQLTADAAPFPWYSGEQGRIGVRLTRGTAFLYWSATRAVVGTVTLTGEVHEDHHADVPEDFPSTAGIVRRIRVETRGLREDPPRSGRSESAHPGVSYRDASASPKWFVSLPSTVGRARVETGVLVDLEVDA